MTGGRLAHLNLKLSSWRDRVGPTVALQRRHAESCGFVDRFSGHLNWVPNAGRTGKADRARPEGHGGSAYHIRFIFAQIISGDDSRKYRRLHAPATKPFHFYSDDFAQRFPGTRQRGLATRR